MRGVNGDMRAVNSASETINAAANAIASGESRVSRATVQKKRWGGCWSIYWCFGSQRHKKRIGHAVLVPETPSPQTHVPAPSNPPSSSISLPFIAPPSSPASFLQSEPPSVAQSPTGLLMSASMYSPGPASIFAIGPYTYETQLVSPPVFSTFTTEPSTAPFTPPPESVHLTTPSSPEVPFAQWLDPNQGFPFSYRELQSYQFQPGSPIGQLISPSSGTSSPFPVGGPPKLLNLDGLSSRDWGSRRSSGSLTPSSGNGFLLNYQLSEASPHGSQNDQVVASGRVSFELSTEAMPRRDRAMNLMYGDESDGDKNRDEEDPGNGEDDRRHRKSSSIALGSVNEFNFGNVDGGDFPRPTGGSETKSWAFFPMIQPGVS